MAQAAKGLAPILNSWKEIAAYLGRGVRTVQRWEGEQQLPVHRIGKGKRSPVYALIPELRFWLATWRLNSTRPPPLRPIIFSQDATTKPNPTWQTSQQLMAESLKLVRTVAESSARQQRQAAILHKRISR